MNYKLKGTVILYSAINLLKEFNGFGTEAVAFECLSDIMQLQKHAFVLGHCFIQ